MTTSRKAHAAEKPKPSISRRILDTVAVFGAAIALALTATGGSYALWTDQAAVNAPSVTSGSTGLTINGVADHTVALTTATLYPGRSVVSATPIVVRNTGTTPLSVTATAPTFTSASSALAPHLTVALWPSAACAQGPAGKPPTALPASMGTVPLVLTPGAQSHLCLEVYLSASAPPELTALSAVFAVQLTGAQVPRS
jgi:predicted ribosomally synthesized peptide with SipW-like signal peptide